MKTLQDMPKPVEIVGNHWIHRDPSDSDATFYRRDEIDAYLKSAPKPVAADGRFRRDAIQETVHSWCVAAFGEGQASSIAQRGLRMLEEAAELAQATGVNLEQAHQLLDYVWRRPVGQLEQELGGLGLTVLALAAAANLSAAQAEEDEVSRVLSKPLDHFRQRNQAKNDAGFLVSECEAHR